MRRNIAAWLTALGLAIGLGACDDEIVDVDLPKDATSERAADGGSDGGKLESDVATADGEAGPIEADASEEGDGAPSEAGGDAADTRSTSDAADATAE
jgi:hypothetical protein